MKPYPRSSAAFSIIEILVALGILGVFAAGMATMFDAQQKQVRQLLQKQDIIEARTQMIMQIGKTAVCTWQLADKTFSAAPPPTEANPSATEISLLNDTLYAGTDATSAPLATANAMLANSNNGLMVTRVSFKGIYATGNPDEYVGNFVVTFDPYATPLPLKPLEVQAIVLTDSSTPLSAKKIISCSGSSSASMQTAVIGSRYATGTVAGNLVVRAWTKRDLNTSVKDPNGIVTISGGQFTLQAGDYLIDADQTYFSNVMKEVSFASRVQNVTDNTTAVDSLNCRFHSYNSGMFGCPAKGLISIDSTKSFELQYFAQTDGSSFAVGAGAANCMPAYMPQGCAVAPHNDGSTTRPEIYATVVITKLK